MGSQRGSPGVSSGQKAEAAAAFGGGGEGSGAAPGGGGAGGSRAGSGGHREEILQLSGIVQTSDGEPIRGARVELDRSEVTTTDATGAFGFENVAPGSHTIVATAAGLHPSRTTVRAGDEAVVITLSPLGSS